MRRLALLALPALSGLALGDRLIDVPVATKLTAGSVRLEEAFGLNNRAFRRDSLLVAVDKTFEVEARRVRSPGRDDTALDVYATLVSPFQGYSPGLATGVRDAGDRTPDGRRFWIAATFREPYEVGDLEIPADITIGGFVGSRGSAFLALSIPLGARLRLLAENDGIRTSAGFQYRPLRNLEVRVFAQDAGVLGSFRYALRF